MKRSCTPSSSSSDQTKAAKISHVPRYTAEYVISNISDDEGDYNDAYPDSDMESVSDSVTAEDVVLADVSVPVPPADATPTQGPDNLYTPRPVVDFSVGWDNNYIPRQLRNQFDESLSGPILIPTGLTSDSEPIDFLQLFLDDSFWNNMLTMTERRVEQAKASNPDQYYLSYMKDEVTVEELKAFLGLRLYMEYFLIKRTYAAYWRSNGKHFLSETPGFPDTIMRDRFLALWTYLHFVDEQDEQLDKRDKIYKVRPVLKDLLSKFRNYYSPKKYLSLDEGMIPCKNRLSIKQYIKDKPVKWGLKSFLLKDSENGYIMDAEIYTGAEPIIYPELGATGNVVIRLLTNSGCDKKGHILVMDRYYNSVLLFQHLHEIESTGAVGTAMTNRKFFPKEIICKKLPNRGDSKFNCHGHITALVWMDKKPIYFLSNTHDPNSFRTAQRRNKDGTLSEVQMPEAVEDYNKYMGGCDLNDQMTRLQRTRKHYKWPRRLFIKMMMWACFNSYILYAATTQHARKPRFMDYLESLCLTLIGNFRSAHVRRARRVETDRRLQNVGIHFPQIEQTTTLGHLCVVCTKKRAVFKHQNPNVSEKDNPHPKTKSTISCTECRVYLCIKRGSTCWVDYHTKKEFWR